MVVVIFVIGIYAWSAGNFKKMTTAYDPDGKGCGVDYPNYPYIYFASPNADVKFISFSHYGSLYAFQSVQCRQTQFWHVNPTV